METRIGAGAQGEVWRGRCMGTRGTLASKVLRAEPVESPDVVEHFIEERSTLLRVRNPCVVAVHDVIIEDFASTIVVDYINSGNLRDLPRIHGSLPPTRMASLETRIAQGLSAVHRAGIIRQGIKPANALLSPHPSRGDSPAGTIVVGIAPGGEVPEAVVPRLANFGVTHTCDTFSASYLTGAIRTPPYMIPKILSLQVPTSTADVHLLGIMLYEMMCGTTSLVGGPVQLLNQHTRHGTGRSLEVSNPLWELTAAMVFKQPDMRPSTEGVAQHLNVMQSVLADLPAAPQPAPPPQPAALLVPCDQGALPPAEPAAPSATLPSPAAISATMVFAPEASTLVGGQQYIPGPGQIPLSPETAGTTGFAAPVILDGPGTSGPPAPVLYN